MKKTIYIIIFLLFLPVNVYAITIGDSYTDVTGKTHYNFSDGTTGSSYVDDVGKLHFNLDDGTYGGAYIDSVGVTHYYYDTNFYNSQNNNSTSICNISYSSFTCFTEDDYQKIYNNAKEGLPNLNNSNSESDSFSNFLFGKPLSELTQDEIDNLIMNGAYGSQLKMCREHIDAYNAAQETYDKCIQREDEKWEKYYKAKLDYLIQSEKNAQTKIEINDLKSLYNDLSMCKDDYWIENNQCVTCSDVYGNKSFANKQSDGSYLCACSDGYGWNSNGTLCVVADIVCQEKYGLGAESNSSLDGCRCKDYYVLNSEGTECIDNWDNIWDSVLADYNEGSQKYSSQNNDNFISEEKKLIIKIDDNLSNRVSGNILLQVEQNGEGWYVNPDNKKKYYLGKPADAFNLMRELGLGIKHSELNKYLNFKFPSRLSGKIMLDVEQNGEAYYVNPTDLKGYYLNRPEDAFRVMRELGLGITNNDIRKIDIGEL